jgi:hypothetical protein
MVNYKEIRKKLRHGDIKRIADSIDIEQRTVSEVLNRGWHPEVRNAVLDAAVKILEEEYAGEADLIERAEAIELGASSFTVPTKYARKKKQDDGPSMKGNTIILVLGILAILAYLFIPAVKTAVTN